MPDPTLHPAPAVAGHLEAVEAAYTAALAAAQNRFDALVSAAHEIHSADVRNAERARADALATNRAMINEGQTTPRKDNTHD